MLVSRTQARNAWHALEAALGINTVDEATPEAVAEALSHGDTRNALELALRSEHPTPGDGYWLWVRDVYDDMVVYEYTTPNDGTLYRRSYTMTDDGAITFGATEAVTAQTVYAPVAGTTVEATSIDLISDVVPLIEKAVRRDNTVSIKVIDAGQGSSGYYPEETIKRDGPRVFTSGTHMYLDHPTEAEAQDRPERTVRDLAGTFVSDAVWQEHGPAGSGLYADAEVFAPFRDVLDEIAPHIGVSIRARGRVEEGEVDGKPTRVITSLEHADSVDFVTRAGRGGSVVSLAESARSARTERIVESTPAVPVTQEVTVDPLEEARNEIATLKTEMVRLSGLRLLDEARNQASTQLAAVDLPAFAKRRILESVTADPAEANGVLDTAALTSAIEALVTAWRADLAEAGAGSYQIEGMGSMTTEPLTEAQSAERLSAAFARLGLPADAATVAATGR